jgi:uncharacterized membrane protein
MGYAMGILGGLVQFWLLRSMVAATMSGRSYTAFALVMAKLLVMIAVLVAVFFVRRDALVPAAIAMAGTIFALSVFSSIAQRAKKGGKA